MPRFLRVVHTVSWLCLLLCGAVATTVQDDNAAIHYDTTWTIDDNGTNSGGSAHHTNISGGTATYSFTGTVISLYGVTHIDGAKFSFSIKDGPSQSCTSWRNDSGTWWFQSQLCTISGLDGSTNHTLTITHTDLTGLWLPLDFFDVTFTNPSISVTPSATSTSSPVASTATTSTGKPSTTSTSQQTQTQTPSPKSSNVAGVAGGVVGGIVGLALICLVAFFLFMRSRQTRLQLASPESGGAKDSTTIPTLPGGSVNDNSSSGANITPPVAGAGGGNTPGPFRPAYNPYAMPPGMTPADASTSVSFMPPQRPLPSMIERSGSQVLSDSRGEGDPSLYPAGVASYAASRGGQAIYQPLMSQEEPYTSSSSGAANSPEIVEMDDRGLSLSDIDGWRSTVGSPPPPSYHTRTQ